METPEPAWAQDPTQPLRERLTQLGLALEPGAPIQAFELLGLALTGGQGPRPQGPARRPPEAPPELFLFGRCPESAALYGVVLDDPDRDDPQAAPIAALPPGATAPCQLLAGSLSDFLSRQATLALDRARAQRGPGAAAHLEDALSRLQGHLPGLRWPVEAEPQALLAAAARQRRCAYPTQDGLGVIVPEEPSPLELISLRSRRGLIESRDRAQVQGAARKALRVGAPGAALALARDLRWELGGRPAWGQVAMEIMEEVYLTLHRPLLAGIARAEWARLFGHP